MSHKMASSHSVLMSHQGLWASSSHNRSRPHFSCYRSSPRLLVTTSASHWHFNAPQASVLAQVMMGSVVNGSQRRRKENLRLRAAGAITNVLIFKHSLVLTHIRYFSIHQFTEGHWYSYYIICWRFCQNKVMEKLDGMFIKKQCAL